LNLAESGALNLGGLGLRGRLFETGSSLDWINLSNKAREVPYLTHVAFKETVRFLQCRFVIAAINNLRRARDAAIIAKFIDAINRHWRAPKCQ
jgi:hypothetical protein